MNPIDIRKLQRVPVTRGRLLEDPGFFPGDEPLITVDFQWMNLVRNGVYLRVIRDWRGGPPVVPRVFISPDSGHYNEWVKISDFPPLVHCPFIYDLTGTEWEYDARNLRLGEDRNIPLVVTGFVDRGPM
jgi:hypothetical protein